MSRYEHAFERLEVVGSRFREDLYGQVQAALVARRGKDAVRLTGPTGSGKELASSFLHEMAVQELGRKGELVRVSCSHLGNETFEQTLFGQVARSTSRTRRTQPGLLDQARGGTLVLDEVQCLSLETQSSLLRLLGEKEYRPIGSSELRRSDALIVLSSNLDLDELTQAGRFRRELLERAPAKITLLPLWQRREDIADLAQHFAEEAARDRGWKEFEGLTRRALADLEGALVARQEASVRRLREVIRDAIFQKEREVHNLESADLEPHLRELYGISLSDRDAWDREDLEDRFDLAIEAQTMARLAQLHGLPEATLLKLAKVLRELHASLSSGSSPVPASYRNLMARMNLATKAALWLLSGARNQSEFRKFFGTQAFEMPPKSVAWQLYHELFGSGTAKETH